MTGIRIAAVSIFACFPQHDPSNGRGELADLFWRLQLIIGLWRGRVRLDGSVDN